MAGADGFTEDVIARIVEPILARSTYVKCPLIDKDGNPTGEYARTLYVAFDPRDRLKAARESIAIGRFIESSKNQYANTSSLNERHLAAEEIEKLCAENHNYIGMTGEQISASEPFNPALNPLVRVKYFIEHNVEDFERHYMGKIGHIIEPSLAELHEELKKQKVLHTEMLEYLKGLTYHDSSSGEHYFSELIANQLYKTDPALHDKWLWLMCSGDTPTDQQREQLGITQDADMVAILGPHQVVNKLYRSEKMDAAVQAIEMGLECPYNHQIRQISQIRD